MKRIFAILALLAMGLPVHAAAQAPADASGPFANSVALKVGELVRNGG